MDKLNLISTLTENNANETIDKDMVEVWFSSEEKPGDSLWYSKPLPIRFTLSRQGDMKLQPLDDLVMNTIRIQPDVKYQTIEGIGTSLEESTIYNLTRMSEAKREEVLRKLVDPVEGIGMNHMRICLGTADFTGRVFYTYDDMPAGEADISLENFSIKKDLDYSIVTVIKEVLSYNTDIKIFASPWSPPGWMKTTDSIIRGQIKPEFIPIAAKYYRMAIQAYEDQGIHIYAMTVQNEPLLEIDYPSCHIPWEQESVLVKAIKKEFAENNIGTKLWIFDHNPEDIVEYVEGVLKDPEAYAAVDGIAVHDYSGELSEMTRIHDMHPEKDIYLTERSVWGTSGMDRIAQYFRNWTRSYNSWVTMLDSDITPHQWVGTPGPTMLIQDAKSPENYWITPEYYLIGQYTRFVQRGAARIYSDYGDSSGITNVAFLNPDDTVVCIVINQTDYEQKFKILCQGRQFVGTLPPKTVGTYKWGKT